MSKELTNKYSEELKEYVLDYISKNGIKLQFKNMQIVQVDRRKYLSEGEYVTVLGVSKEELKKFKHNFVGKLKSIEYYINTILEQYKEDESYDKISELYLQLKLLDYAIIYKHKELSKKYYLVNYYIDTNPFEARKLYRRVIIEKDLNPEYLYTIPAEQNILSKISRDYESDSLAKITLELMALAEKTDNRSSIVKSLLKSMESIAQKESVVLAKDLLHEIESSSEAPLLQISQNTMGNIYLSSNLNSKPNTFLQKAKALFRKHGDLKEIENYLQESIKISPANYENLDYLAAVYNAMGKSKKELLLYNIMLRMNPDNIEILAKKASLLKKLGYDKMSYDYFNYLKIVTYDKQIKSRYVKKLLKGKR
ncbi:MAG TPA: hypothetical protein EYG74_04995 [Sulfurimonas autotrophica]|nr:hypothetical protein [Sulfurimonas autotrophica]